MPLIVAVVLLKGGVAKSTVSVGLAEQTALGARTVLLDCDPQGSSMRWSQLAAESGQALRSTVVPMAAADLPRRIHTVTRGYAAVIIDGPPPGPGAAAIAGGAVSVADIVVAPTPAEYATLDRVPITAKLAAEHGKPILATLTMVRGGLTENDAARAALAGWGVRTATAELPLRAEVQRCYGQAVTGTLARYSLDLLSEILDITQEGNTNA
jgi:chromosome partitioning protein